ncbi:hypothetical protein MAR_026302 [Mya arenaria]|uniref:TLC domain-containing protein n=1 Tax=Mya arenaria TaxID=6604 RepID=A0ABY7ESK4_MYAAR|nr:uncharacterized protein LOC128244608 [Mya arenaria]WAR12122.1 hypothetical protein MAR_026302 [Mya arenaria]
MNDIYLDIMVISLTLNWCVLSFNLVPRLRVRIAASSLMSGCCRLLAICRMFEERPLLLSKIFTEQILTWSLVILSMVAVSASDVIKHPFHVENADGHWYVKFITVIFAINIGRYLFIFMETLFSKRSKSKSQFRAQFIHHIVTIVCYAIFLVTRQNLLLGLIGVFIETTNIFDEIGRIFKQQGKTNTPFFRRVVTIGCVFTVTFRGIVPTTFLVMAMFQQSPFTMSTPTLMIFFLSMIFYSVMNVWQILASLQRFKKYMLQKTPHDESPTSFELRTVEDRSPYRTGKTLLLSKNNLGYLRPYDNKNIAFQNNSIKENIGNKKDTAKEAIQLKIDPVSYFEEKRKLSDIAECQDHVIEKEEHSNNSNDSGISLNVDEGAVKDRDVFKMTKNSIRRKPQTQNEKRKQRNDSTEIENNNSHDANTNVFNVTDVRDEVYIKNNACKMNERVNYDGESSNVFSMELQHLRISNSSEDSNNSEVLLLNFSPPKNAKSQSTSAIVHACAEEEPRVHSYRSLSVDHLADFL